MQSYFLEDISRMATSEEEITKLYRIQRTIMQMLNDRGYIVADHELNLSKQRFIDKYGEHMKRDALSIQKTRRNDSSDQVFFVFSLMILISDFRCKWYMKIFYSVIVLS